MLGRVLNTPLLVLSKKHFLISSDTASPISHYFYCMILRAILIAPAIVQYLTERDDEGVSFRKALGLTSSV